MKKFKKGQSTLEYVIILAAVVGAIIAVAAMFKPKLVTTYDSLSNTMQGTVGRVNFN